MLIQALKTIGDTPRKALRAALACALVFGSVLATAELGAFETDQHQAKTQSSLISGVAHSVSDVPAENNWASERGNVERLYNALASQNRLTLAQSDNSQLRSRSEVVREVKRQYNAEVLKIRLNQQRTAYKVRILMPSGRVREVSVSARR